MRKGGESDPRNKTLMKMFNLVNIGERSGSGVPNIFNTWEDQGWKEGRLNTPKTHRAPLPSYRKS